ncbi:MAG: DUF2842 domain-containing protein [Pseudomonadota bacterium]
MNPRIKKLVGSIGVVIYLIVYAFAAIILADKIPDHPALDLLYFVVAGVGWILPIIPLMVWMNRD